MKRSILLSLFGLLTIIILHQCKVKNSGVTLDITKTYFEQLSMYHFFNGKISDLLPNEGVLPYDLITPLFTDYAEKSRFVWMPKGTSAKFSKDEVFDFPVGTVLIKNFYYPFDFRDPSKGKQILETRLLIRKENGWDALDYVWNDEQTDAQLEVVGGNKMVKWIDTNGQPQQTNYSIPNKNQCKNCHNFNDVFTPIGPKARYLNHDFTYSDGATNQLEKWTTSGYLTGYKKEENTLNKVAKWDDPASGTLEERAKAYLEVNCAHCHRKEGSANTSGLYLLLSDQNPESWGIMKSPVAAGQGSGSFLFDVVPGKPEASILPYRMASLEPAVMMPEMGRTMVHQEAIDLIKQWIAEMK